MKFFLVLISILVFVGEAKEKNIENYINDPSSFDIEKDLLEKFLKDFDEGYNILKKSTERIFPIQSGKTGDRFFKSLSTLYSEKIAQNLDKTILMQIEEYGNLNNNVITDSEVNGGRVVDISGNQVCSLDDQKTLIKSICPWHNELRFRPNMFPHRRTFAKCNCLNCLKFNGFDQLTTCEPIYTIMPALIKISTEWNFVMERVPTSCHCTVNLDSYG
ncbi:unnamed protein product [Brachionus calyciflorus]|uniref:Uncharacterized protein n=1 Tax=Brachionus calyciflorus TaxID=104777 RepID=A0A814HF72_9BILA|nr:unnamed protein product [Brachionus calyciflorus]